VSNPWVIVEAGESGRATRVIGPFPDSHRAHFWYDRLQAMEYRDRRVECTQAIEWVLEDEDRKAKKP
jgi:hypothetical protein